MRAASALLAPFIFRSSTANRYSLGFYRQNTFCDAAREPFVVTVCHVVPEPRGSLSRLIRSCLALFVAASLAFFASDPVFSLVTATLLQISITSYGASA